MALSLRRRLEIRRKISKCNYDSSQGIIWNGWVELGGLRNRLNSAPADESAGIQAEIEEVEARLAYAERRMRYLKWRFPGVIALNVLLVVLAGLIVGGPGVAATFCPSVAFWVIGYGIIWKVILNK